VKKKRKTTQIKLHMIVVSWKIILKLYHGWKGVGKDGGREREKVVWEKREGRAIFPNSNPRERKERGE
jgi:hypothetical protein